MAHDSNSTFESGTRAVLVGVQLPGMSQHELDSSLHELARLARTLGLETVARVTQQRPSTSAPTVLGAGKLRQLARLTGGTGVVPAGASKRHKGSRPYDQAMADDELGAEPGLGGDGDDDGEELPVLAEDRQADVILFDHDLTPSQLRNLEGASAVEVLDRSSVILHIFQRHARSREARLQVEVARLSYLAPRLRASGASADRQRGGIGGKGAGESALELDRRRVRDRIAELKRELRVVQREAQTRRSRRVRHDTIVLVGYTNAGKSSLMRVLTCSEPLVRNQLFATLDTTVRVLQPETRPRLLVSDTVGFIKRLPHDLVASFRSTLEEAREGALLLHLVDASDPAWRSQFEVTQQVLSELGAGETPSLVVLNKADRLDRPTIAALALEMPEAHIMSAFRKDDVAALHGRIVAFFERDMVDDELFVSYRDGRLVHTVHETCRVLGEAHSEQGTTLRVRAPAAVIDQLRAELQAESCSQ